MALTTESAARKDKRNAFAGTMEHRHFATIAAIIEAIPESTQRRDTARLFAMELRGTNSKFDRKRFLTACGFPNGID